MLPSFLPAILALTGGTVFRDYSTGAAGHAIGKVVFNTAITGCQEIPTDPSYSHQIVALTYPHIGNASVNHEDIEATKVRTAGLVIKDLPILASNFRKEYTPSHYLKGKKIVTIAGINTRKLTRILREKGAQDGCILAGKDNVQKAIDLSCSFPGLSDIDLTKVVSVTGPCRWTRTEWALSHGCDKQEALKYHVVAYDSGVKSDILRMLAKHGCCVTVVPAQINAADVLAHNPDGVFLSNGPDDLEPYDYAIATTKEFLERRLPTFGIYLGRQIMGLAVSARTFKIKTGHHGTSHPVKDLQDGRVVITSQSHGLAVDPESLPASTRVTHASLFDGMPQGFELTDRPAFCFQGHPEASPGPYDVAYLFGRFTAAMDAVKQ